MSNRLNFFEGVRAACLCIGIFIMTFTGMSTPAYAGQVSVRFPEGMTHGFLQVGRLPGRSLARAR